MSKIVFIYFWSFFFGLFSLARSQTIWTKYPGNPVLSPGTSGSWDNGGVIEPAVLFDGGQYHMWYTAIDNPNNPNPVLKIGYTTSSDGIIWTKYQNNPVIEPGTSGSWDDVRIRTGKVLLEGNVYKMWYGGYDGTYWRIGYATSPDGIIWTKHPDPVLDVGTAGEWDAGFVTGPAVVNDGSSYHMWYDGSAAGGVGDMKIGYATSPDGLTWTKNINNPVLIPDESWANMSVTSPDVILKNNLFHMWYGGHSNIGSYWGTGYATSVDGINWIKYWNNPVLAHGPSGSWDDKEVWGARVVLNEADHQYHLWYHGSSFSANSLYKIGYATAPVTIHVPGDVPTIQAGIDSASDGNIVLVDEGTYYENINFKGKAITVASHFLVDEDTSHISNTIIDGSQPSNPDSGSVVYIISGEDSTTTLTGFTITHGTGTVSSFQGSIFYGGGGIFVDSSSCVIRNNKIINNSLSFRGLNCEGAGIEVNYSNCIIEKNIIKYNAINEPSNWGGGAGIDIYGKSLTIRNNIISDNSIVHNWGAGAGVLLYLPSNSDTIYFTDNIVQRNTCNSSQFVGGGGLGIVYCKGEVIVSGNLITHNESRGGPQHIYGEGGGIYIENCNPVVTNNIITHNQAGHASGIAVCYYSGYQPQPTRPLIINNTITRNKASVHGGGLCSYGSQAHPTIINTILWGDSASGLPNEIYNFLSGQITVQNSDIEGGYSGEGNIDSDPFLHDSLITSGDTMYCCLAANSPCIDAGHSHPNYYDPEDPMNPGFALWPAMGTLRNDIGAHGGPGKVVVGFIRNDKKTPAVSTYMLSQNYPNPFNPTTTIAFDLPKSSKVTLKIFNILGEEVTTLLSASLLSGSYKYEWDASDLASGVYLYRLQAGNYVETRKMILMR